VLKGIGCREKDADFGTFKAKDFRCHGQLKRIDGVVYNGRNGMHGSFLMLSVFSATGRSISIMAKS
jgi:hypothetical protein